MTRQQIRNGLGKGDERKLLAAIDRRSLRQFVADAWPYAVPAATYEYNWHVGAICEHLDALYKLQIRNLLINVPPRFGKSNLCSVMYPAWLWLQDPRLRLLYSSYSLSLSIRDSLNTRKLIESRWYQERWADKFYISKDQNEKMRFENNFKGYRLATAVAGSNTGEGGDFIICDDPHNVQEIESDITRESVLRWWNEVMSTRGNDPRTVRRLVIAQRAHFGDLSADILEKGDYVHLNLPMEYEKQEYFFLPPEGITWRPKIEDPRKEEGEPLWTPRYDAAEIAKLKIKMGSHAYNAQMQQRPAPRGGGMFKRDKVQFYTLSPQMLLEKKVDDGCWSWDCTFKALDDSDFVVGQAWIRVGGDFYLLHQVRDRMTFGATKKMVIACRSKFQHPKLTRILIEDKANGTAVVDDLKHTVPGLHPVEPEGGKDARASVVEPLWEAGNIYLPANAPWVESYIQEFIEFPKGAYDDQVDSTSQAIVYLMKRFNVPAWGDVSSVTRSTLPWHKEQQWTDPRGE